MGCHAAGHGLIHYATVPASVSVSSSGQGESYRFSGVPSLQGMHCPWGGPQPKGSLPGPDPSQHSGVTMEAVAWVLGGGPGTVPAVVMPHQTELSQEKKQAPAWARERDRLKKWRWQGDRQKCSREWRRGALAVTRRRRQQWKCLEARRWPRREAQQPGQAGRQECEAEEQNWPRCEAQAISLGSEVAASMRLPAKAQEEEEEERPGHAALAPGHAGSPAPLIWGTGSSQVPQSKYAELLAIIEELGKEIRPTYAGSKSAMERLKRGIIHARGLVRECLAETERNARS
ncbi:cyclin-dependent kinase 2-associated protein 1 isoform X1 [Oryctolagus cuniculus]|uniref:cyclin-dependent kinase 2-associated protein 1 isoform X1 n=1 Tax=Oryctolagus cuniculus TaxID=9986 RepID=UPI00222F3DD6|nr:cyclin-dependent kinase 2-associated protein 1 isoform X1 [Oryctolagus cuniculus]